MQGIWLADSKHGEPSLHVIVPWGTRKTPPIYAESAFGSKLNGLPMEIPDEEHPQNNGAK